MSLRKGLLFTMLFAIVALAEPGTVNVYKAEFDVPKPNTLLRAPAPATAALPWYSSWPANKPSRWLKALRRKGELLPASFLPIQFKNPKDGAALPDGTDCFQGRPAPRAIRAIRDNADPVRTRDRLCDGSP